MSNNHYVPKLVLKKFKNKLCLYNVRTGEYKENVSVEDAYCEEELFVGKRLSSLIHDLETRFDELLDSKLLGEGGRIVLSGKEVELIKSFLLLSIFTCPEREKLAWAERVIIDGDRVGFKARCPFLERYIEDETEREYWIRTLKVILDTDGNVDRISEHTYATYAAWKWALIVQGAHLAFWDAPDGEELVITDVGMAAENEIGCDGKTVRNYRKLEYLINACMLEKSKSKRVFSRALNGVRVQANFGENFMMFPISTKRMIVLLPPYFGRRYYYEPLGASPIPFEELTNIKNPDLFTPGKAVYKRGKNGDLFPHAKDRHTYDVKQLSHEDLGYCNSLFLDRADEHAFFSSLDAVGDGVLAYRKLYIDGE